MDISSFENTTVSIITIIGLLIQEKMKVKVSYLRISRWNLCTWMPAQRQRFQCVCILATLRQQNFPKLGKFNFFSGLFGRQFTLILPIKSHVSLSRHYQNLWCRNKLVLVAGGTASCIFFSCVFLAYQASSRSKSYAFGILKEYFANTRKIVFCL